MLNSTLTEEVPFVALEDGIALAQAVVDTVRDFYRG